uniref:Uncharacterized protein n=1 Tax=Setaria italica TaxID=4555 RepID=K3ZFD0_SETIT
MVDTLYNPTVGANIISGSYALTFLGDKLLAPTDKSFRSSSGDLLEQFGVLQNMSIGHRGTDAILDFHAFEVQDFDILIRHPIQNFLLAALTLGKLNVQLGKDSPKPTATEEEWLKEVKRSSKAIRISSPPTTISCSIRGTTLDALDDSTAEACIMFEFLTDTFLGNMPLVPTNRLLKGLSRLIFECSGEGPCLSR